MKKIFAALFAAVIALCFCSCGGTSESSAQPSQGSAEAAVSAKPLKEIFEDVKTQVGIENLTELSNVRTLDRYYGITEDKVSEFAGGNNSSGVSQEEIVLIKAVDDNAAAAVEASLNDRYNSKLEQSRNYNPEQAAVIEKCKVQRDGLYVSMIVSENADRITDIYRTEAGLK